MSVCWICGVSAGSEGHSLRPSSCEKDLRLLKFVRSGWTITRSSSPRKENDLPMMRLDSPDDGSRCALARKKDQMMEKLQQSRVKRLAAVVMAATLLFGAAACSDDDADDPDQIEDEVDEVEDELDEVESEIQDEVNG